MAPSLSAVTARLRDLNAYYDGPATVCLFVAGSDWYVGIEWDGRSCESYGAEHVPGDGAPFDAVAAARRLLSDYRSDRP